GMKECLWMRLFIANQGRGEDGCHIRAETERINNAWKFRNMVGENNLLPALLLQLIEGWNDIVVHAPSLSIYVPGTSKASKILCLSNKISHLHIACYQNAILNIQPPCLRCCDMGMW